MTLYGLLDHTGPLHSAFLAACLLVALGHTAHVLWCLVLRESPSRLAVLIGAGAPLLYAGVSGLYVVLTRDVQPVFGGPVARETLRSLAVSELTYTHAVAGLIASLSSTSLLLGALVASRSRNAADWRAVAMLSLPLLVAGVSLLAVGLVSLEALELGGVLRESGRQVALGGLRELGGSMRHGFVLATLLAMIPILAAAWGHAWGQRAFVVASVLLASIGVLSLDRAPVLAEQQIDLLVEAEAIESGTYRELVSQDRRVSQQVSGRGGARL